MYYLTLIIRYASEVFFLAQIGNTNCFGNCHLQFHQNVNHINLYFSWREYRFNVKTQTRTHSLEIPLQKRYMLSQTVAFLTSQ